jgi:hypothetical protein
VSRRNRFRLLGTDKYGADYAALLPAIEVFSAVNTYMYLSTAARRIALLPSRRLSSASVLQSASGTTEEKLVYPEPVSAEHHDLSSFLNYAENTGLDPKSTVFVGTHFEYTVRDTLGRYGFYLKRTGGRLDGGIDLIGTWTIPSTTQRLEVLLQCKSGNQLLPHHIRELEGTFNGAPAGWRGPGVLGLLVTEKTATAGVRDSLRRSQKPMGFISCAKEGMLRQVLWNHAAEEEGLDGLGVTMRHASKPDEDSQLAWTWKGKPVPFVT